MAAQKKWGKNGYLKDFKAGQEKGYVYTGVCWQAAEPERRRLFGRLWAFQSLSLFSSILPGLFTVEALLNTFYAIIPYVLWLIGDIYLTCLLGRMTLGGNPMRGYVYERSVARFAPFAAVPLAGALLTAAGVFLFVAKGGGREGAGMCLLCCALQGTGFFLIKKNRCAGIWQRIQ